MALKLFECGRITRSAMSSELIALEEMFENTIALSQDRQNITSKPVLVQLLSEKKRNFLFISTDYRILEKVIMLNIATT